MPAFDTALLHGESEQARLFRSFLLALGLTIPMLLFTSAHRIVSLEATLAASAAGLLLGGFFGLSLDESVLAAVGLGDVALTERLSELELTVVVLAFLCVITLAVWLLLPRNHIGTFVQFCIVFTWALPATELLCFAFGARYPE